MTYARTLAVLAALAAAGAFAQQRPNRRTVLSKLAADTDAGMARATLSEKDQKDLVYSRDLVREMAGVKGSLAQTDRDDLRKAFKNIGKRSKAFQPADRKLIDDDIRQARKLGLDRQARARGPRPFRMPPPRIRRWPYRGGWPY